MTRLLIDTSAYSGFKRGVGAIVEAMRDADRLFMSGIVLGELRAGFAAGDRQARNEAELRAFTILPRVEMVGVDEGTSVYYAAIYASLRRAGTPVPSNDLWIAATAMQHGLIVLTRDAHFRLVSQIVVQGLD